MTKLKAVNFIPQEHAKKHFFKTRKAPVDKKDKDLRSLRNFIVLSVLIAIGVSVMPALSVNVYKLNAGLSKYAMDNAKAKLNKLQAQILQFEKLRADLGKEETLKKQRLNLLLATSSKGKNYSDLLLTLGNLLPQDLWLKRFALKEENEIEISGSTLDNQLVTQLMNKLDESKYFKNSRFVSCEKQTQDAHALYKFEITTEPGWKEVKEPVKENKEAGRPEVKETANKADAGAQNPKAEPEKL